MRCHTLLLLIFLLFAASVHAVAQSPDTTVVSTEKSKGIIPIPVLYYTPDTKLGFGAALIGFFKLQSKTDSTYTRLSTVKLIADYTLNKQTDQWLEWNIFTRNEKYLLRGELRHRIYTDRFYGTSNNSSVDNEEKYEYDLIGTKLAGIKRIGNKTFFGPDLQLTKYYNLKTNPIAEDRPSQLEEQQVSGYQGGINNGLGLIFMIDSRDNVSYASRGVFLEASGYGFGSYLGGDFSYSNYNLNFSKYFQLKGNHILASNTVLNINTNEVPFMRMATLGGDRLLRGYARSRYMARNVAATQVEYRFPVWRRFGMAAFTGIGDVFDSTSDLKLKELKYTIGTGLRFALNPKEKINVRVDAGYGKEGANFFVVLGEAF
ncbi:BamA/TamA family outer membrane protein [Pontibacter sp. KCTC 32443]|uniref:BamA/TamA family outer membrane protein n=1 Tax=Pontibacter TaxID=323449 RepID=UPI00164D4C6F|nr:MULTISPECIES: BamA/TamA family outer membrane protein [Pontibacter]MBC5772509.1 BamA/TamA family outer membrane protein [Pontibacter sp. KCTC 32443]